MVKAVKKVILPESKPQKSEDAGMRMLAPFPLDGPGKKSTVQLPMTTYLLTSVVELICGLIVPVETSMLAWVWPPLATLSRYDEIEFVVPLRSMPTPLSPTLGSDCQTR